MGVKGVRTTLPVHPVPAASGGSGTIRVDGRVGCPRVWRVADLDSLVQRAVMDDFVCVEGWSVPGVIWQGIPLAAILERAHVDADARWIQASAGEFSVPLSLDDARRALLALWMGGKRLPVAHGGPVRLVVPGRECFTSIKWLDHLEARIDPLPDRAREVALGRLRREAEATKKSEL